MLHASALHELASTPAPQPAIAGHDSVGRRGLGAGAAPLALRTQHSGAQQAARRHSLGAVERRPPTAPELLPAVARPASRGYSPVERALAYGATVHSHPPERWVRPGSASAAGDGVRPYSAGSPQGAGGDEHSGEALSMTLPMRGRAAALLAAAGHGRSAAEARHAASEKLETIQRLGALQDAHAAATAAVAGAWSGARLAPLDYSQPSWETAPSIYGAPLIKRRPGTQGSNARHGGHAAAGSGRAAAQRVHTPWALAERYAERDALAARARARASQAAPLPPVIAWESPGVGAGAGGGKGIGAVDKIPLSLPELDQHGGAIYGSSPERGGRTSVMAAPAGGARAARPGLRTQRQ